MNVNEKISNVAHGFLSYDDMWNKQDIIREGILYRVLDSSIWQGQRWDANEIICGIIEEISNDRHFWHRD